MVQQEEKHIRVMQNHDQRHENAAAFVVSYFTKGEQYSIERVSYKHCGKLGHEAANCFEIVDYPSSRNTRDRRSSQGRGWGGKEGGRSNRGRGQGGYHGKELINVA